MPNAPYILSESEVLNNVSYLDSAWVGPATFAFLSEKTGVSRSWVEQELAKLPPEFEEGHFVLFTSGSTGSPKLIIGSKSRAEKLARVLNQLQEGNAVEETICLLPLTYCYAFVNQWLWSRIHKKTLVLTPGLVDPERLRNSLANAQHAMICLVGAQVSLLLNFFDGLKFEGIIRIHFAGGRFPQERLDDLYRLFPNAEVFNNYGCAEAMPRLTLRKARDSDHAHHVGWPLPNIHIKCDVNSRVMFRSPFGAVALIDEDGFTKVEEDTWLATGDLGCVADDGHLDLLGREGEVFKRYGEKVSIPQILNQIRALWTGQADCYREPDHQGEMGFVVVLAPHPEGNEVRMIMKELSLHYARSHWPLRVESLPHLPRLANDKVNRTALERNPDAINHWKQRI